MVSSLLKPYYDRDGITIYCGDCLKVMPQLSPYFDGIFADLPYGTTNCEWDSVIPLEILWTEYKRLIKRNGPIVLNSAQPFTSALVMSNPKWFKYDVIWHKSTATGHLNAQVAPMREHEEILIFGDGLVTYNPQIIKKDPKNIRPFTDRAASTQKVYGHFNGNTPRTIPLDMTYPRSVIDDIPNTLPEGRYHNTQKPERLMIRLIHTYTNPGDLILDNTMGSGTVLVVAQNEGRRAVGIELKEEFCKIAVDRLRQPSFFSLPEMKPEPVKTEQKKMEL